MPDAPARSSSPVALFAALGGALAAVMILALVTPRWSSDSEVSWLVTLVGGLLVGAITYAVLVTRKGKDTIEEEPPR